MTVGQPFGVNIPPSPAIRPRERIADAKRWIRSVVFGVVDGVLSKLPTHAESGQVLIVRLDAIGDFVMWQRAATRLRALYPGQRIVLAANAVWATLATRLPYWDEVISIDVPRLQRSPVYRCQTLLKIRRRGFSVAVHPTYSRTFFAGDAVVRLSAARHRIGADGDLSNMSARQKGIADRWYTQLVASGANLTEIEQNHHFLQGLGWPDKKIGQYRMPEVDALPDHLTFDRPYFIVFPGASWWGKQWPEQAFASVIDETQQRHEHWQPVLCGSANERALCAAIAALATTTVVNLAGKTSLPEFCELVRRAQLLIGNDTSAVHIAAAVGTPSVCLLGGGHFGRFLPYPTIAEGPSPEPVYVPMPCYGCNWKCHLPHTEGKAVPCVAAITVSAVMSTVEGVLLSTERPTGHSTAVTGA